jgi:hypothetical protein
MSAAMTRDKSSVPLLSEVALLAAQPNYNLRRGQVGTVLERLDDRTLLVEFSDDEGRAYALAPCPEDDLLVLHHLPEAA